MIRGRAYEVGVIGVFRTIFSKALKLASAWFAWSMSEARVWICKAFVLYVIWVSRV